LTKVTSREWALEHLLLPPLPFPHYIHTSMRLHLLEKIARTVKWKKRLWSGMDTPSLKTNISLQKLFVPLSSMNPEPLALKFLPTSEGENTLSFVIPKMPPTFMKVVLSAIHTDFLGAYKDNKMEIITYTMSGDDIGTRVAKDSDGQWRTIRGKLLNPQPSQDNLLQIFHQTKQHKSGNFARRVSKVLSPEVCHLSIVQFRGDFVANLRPAAHGNSTKQSSSYVAQPKQAAMKARELCKSTTSGHAYLQMRLDGEDIRNKNAVKKVIPPIEKRPNLADQHIELLSMMSEKVQYLQKVVTLYDHPPAAILYYPSQMNDLRTFCTDRAPEPLCLSFDRTFNLSPYFVTATTFRHKFLKKRGQNNNAIFLGP